MTHAKRFSPSASNRWMACTASVALSLKAPPQLPSVYAEEGTKAHELCEVKLKGGGYDIADYNAEMDEHSDEYADYVADLSVAGRTRPVQVEQKVTCTTVSEEIFGTADAIVGFYGDEHIHVVDFKYGMAVVPIESPQLKIYGLAAMMEYGAKRVTVHIYQPRTTPPNIVQKTYTKDEMLDFAQELRDTLRIVDTYPSFKLGDHCKYCPALSICPEQLQEFKADLPDVQTITAEEVGMILDKIPGVEAFIKQMRAKALELAAQGEKVPGWKRVAGRRGAKKWANIEDVKFPPRVYDKKLMTPTKMAKEFPKVFHKFAPHIEQTEGKPTLVPESDKRKELQPSVLQDFEKIGE